VGLPACTVITASQMMHAQAFAGVTSLQKRTETGHRHESALSTPNTASVSAKRPKTTVSKHLSIKNPLQRHCYHTKSYCPRKTIRHLLYQPSVIIPRLPAGTNYSGACFTLYKIVVLPWKNQYETFLLYPVQNRCITLEKSI
jgi:hypothetical protein